MLCCQVFEFVDLFGSFEALSKPPVVVFSQIRVVSTGYAAVQSM
jgi:hypothetical protein